MDQSVVVSSFALLFLAEMGDKTQLVAMTLAHRYRVMPVIAGVFAAFLALNLLAVLVGEALFRIVPRNALLLAAGALFLFFAWRSWRDANQSEDKNGSDPASRRGAFVASFTLLFVAELGDKTQLALVALVAGTGQPWSVFLGGTLALWTVALIGILLGSTLLRRVPKIWMHRVAAALFLVFGLVAIGGAILGESTTSDVRANHAPASRTVTADQGAASKT
jgi:putative Ca2+/H+ antiporter (TMEM165/GDT1 family)